MKWCILVLILLVATDYSICDDILVLTVSTKPNDALDRFLRSAEHNNFEAKVLGLGVEWKGGNISTSIGGGQKINILKDALADLGKQLILFVDSYDVVFMDTKERLLEEYAKIGSKVVFAAEDFCWPQKNLEEQYPSVEKNEKRFLNSGGFIGPADVLREIVTFVPVKDEDDDQLYYTQIFLNTKIREELGIALDKKAAIFQNLHGAFAELELKFTETTGYLYNSRTDKNPIIAHGNGPIKPEFNSVANYLAYSWTPTKGCQQCLENLMELKTPEDYPVIQMSIIVEWYTPFLDVFFERISALTYPKNLVHLTLYMAKEAAIQQRHVDQFTKSYEKKYRSFTLVDPVQVQDEGAAHDVALARCISIEECKFLLIVHGSVQLTKKDTVEHLVYMNRSMIAPLVARRGKLWSNFWGALSSTGYYERADDYLDILNGTKVGIWNEPFIRDVYLMSRWAMQTLSEVKLAGSNEPEMVLARVAREKYVFMLVDNQHEFGYLINTNSTAGVHATDLWELIDNPLDWEEQYVHPDYFPLAKPHVKMEDFAQPCPDVFWLPLLSEKMCKELIEEVEASNLWSDGSNQDSRLEGGYENVPTRDVHMRQIDWEEHWLQFLVKYVHPIQKKLYFGYDDVPWARMNFVVRYKPDEQPSLRPHHDASSYTLNTALNKPGVAYSGGGTRFVRYNCSMVESRVGWTTVSPGRVTHLHEGLTTTAGTRYIFVTFINP